MDYKKSALLVIDMQNDFMQGGSLAVANANELIDPINDLMKLEWGLIVASKDWHPKNQISFASNHLHKKPFENVTLGDGKIQDLWPDHCIQNSRGAEIHEEIQISLVNNVILKGQNPNVDSYSAFFDNNELEKTELDYILKKHNITDIYIVGLAGDYCVKFTALDGQKLGYTTYCVIDATKFVNPDSYDSIYKELQANNVNLIDMKKISS